MPDIDPTVAEARALLIDAAAGLDAIAFELIGLHDSWHADGAPAPSLAWLAGLIGQLGWWNGRFTNAVVALSPGD
jgi:hypothetical protein